jgi:D-lactate dehydrogenase
VLSCRFSLYEPVEFINTFLKDKLEWKQVRDNVAIHVPCTSKKLGVTSAFEQVAGLCAKEVTPSGIPCCGMWRPPSLPHYPFQAPNPF